MGLIDRLRSLRGRIEWARHKRQIGKHLMLGDTRPVDPAERARMKLEAGERKQKAIKLIEKAKEMGVDLQEYEALAYVARYGFGEETKSEKRRETESVLEALGFPTSESKSKSKRKRRSVLDTLAGWGEAYVKGYQGAFSAFSGFDLDLLGFGELGEPRRGRQSKRKRGSRRKRGSGGMDVMNLPNPMDYL